jgi:hypothetical protein
VWVNSTEQLMTPSEVDTTLLSTDSMHMKTIHADQLHVRKVCCTMQLKLGSCPKAALGSRRPAQEMQRNKLIANNITVRAAILTLHHALQM